MAYPGLEPKGPALDEPLDGVEGEGQADAIAETELRTVRTVGQYRGKLKAAVARAGDPASRARLQTASANLERISQGHDHVAVEDLEPGVKGVNYRVGTRRTALGRGQLRLAQLVENPADVDETLDHEDDPALGHAGQIEGLQGLVIDEGEGGTLEGTELYEGEEEGILSEHKRGSVQSHRGDQPAENYGSGQKKVADIGLKVVSAYVREGKSRADTQAEIFKKTRPPREKMFRLLTENGYSDEETAEVMEKVAA